MDSTLTVQLERGGEAAPLFEQLAAQIRRGIESGGLPAGSRLPSTRALAAQLAVSRTVTGEAYATLIAEGYLDSRRGSGTFVVELLPKPAGREGDRRRARSARGDEGPPAKRASTPRWLSRRFEEAQVDPPADPAIPFRICEPDAESFPDQAWRTAARSAIREPIPEGYPPPEGDEGLRRAVAAFLFQERGLQVDADELILTSGTAQSLDLIARATIRPGDRIAFEDPGYRLARQIFTDRGAEILPVPVDEEGLRVERLMAACEGQDAAGSRPLPTAVYLTPSHQFPYGSALCYRRRLALLEWAARREVLVIEDDYDSEFRFDGPILPSLKSSDERGDVAAYLGTFSKSLSPRLRVGYLIAPEPLREAVLRLRVRSDQGSSWLTQRALAHYLQSGSFTRHLRRMRRLYRRRRDLLIQSLEPLESGLRWSGLAAGLHATLILPESLSADLIVERCRERGVNLATLRHYQAAGSPESSSSYNGLVVGYGASSEDQIETAARILRSVLASARPHAPPGARSG
ncbi:MAG: PLP-dependent aminotransferase family protein [Acidobacteriota bacterium]